jgi:hypothetical protein
MLNMSRTEVLADAVTRRLGAGDNAYSAAKAQLRPYFRTGSAGQGEDRLSRLVHVESAEDLRTVFEPPIPQRMHRLPRIQKREVPP